jgi:hypothetical protein
VLAKCYSECCLFVGGCGFGVFVLVCVWILVLCYFLVVGICFIGVFVFFCLEVGCVGKLAFVTFELVDESCVFSDGVVVEELLGWFREVVAVPWVKEVRWVVVKRF